MLRLTPLVLMMLLSPSCSDEPASGTPPALQGSTPSALPFDQMTEQEILAMDAGTWAKAVPKQLERMANTLAGVRDVESARSAQPKLDHYVNNLEQLMTLRVGNLAPPSPDGQKLFDRKVAFYFQKMQDADKALGDNDQVRKLLQPSQQRVLELLSRFRPKAPK